MRIAIMQPYFFPFVGYFQLVNAADKFVFYDDVHFIKRGYINRNAILVNGAKKRITISLKEASQNKLINEIAIARGNDKLLKTIRMAYAKAPFFRDAFPVVERVFENIAEDVSIANAAGSSVVKVAEYLGLNTRFEYSSQQYPDSRGKEKAARLIQICRQNGAKTYMNAAGGKELYTKEAFRQHGVELRFIENHLKEYDQFGNDFIPYLSIIDVMMFNSPEEIRKMLDDYQLE